MSEKVLARSEKIAVAVLSVSVLVMVVAGLAILGLSGNLQTSNEPFEATPSIHPPFKIEDCSLEGFVSNVTLELGEWNELSIHAGDVGKIRLDIRRQVENQTFCVNATSSECYAPYGVIIWFRSYDTLPRGVNFTVDPHPMELADNGVHSVTLKIATSPNAETTSFWIFLTYTFEYTTPIPNITTLCPFAKVDIIFGKPYSQLPHTPTIQIHFRGWVNFWPAEK